jgi:tRNA-2-methylthio-N6-dimethylallyladenosine synthase
MVNFMMAKTVYIYTYGCQMNVHDSEKMLGALGESGYHHAESPEKADLVIFNTCAIREKAEQKFYSQLGRTRLLKRKNPNMKIAVAGCVAQDAKKRIIEKAPFVDYVFGPQNLHLVRDLDTGEGRVRVEDYPEIAFHEYAMNRQSRIKAWVTIMYGCDNFCSYCIVPYTRGREVSRSSSSILAEVRGLKERGYLDITLLGQNVNSYRSDMGFAQLLKEIDRIGLERVRFVTSHPRDLSDELISAIADLASICEHLHLPLQSGSDDILRRMNRRYSYSEYREKVDRIRSKVPGIALTTDIIIGFPGETVADFGDTMSALRDIAFDGIFSFKYSRRRGTKAGDLKEQVPDNIKSERLTRLLSLQEEITLRNNVALEGTVQEMLIEGPSDTDRKMLMGRTRTNKIVTIEDEGQQEGTFVRVRIVKARHHSLLGIRLT